MGHVVDRGLELHLLHFGGVHGLVLREHQEDVRDLGFHVVEGQDLKLPFLVVDPHGEHLEQGQGDLRVALEQDLEVLLVELQGGYRVHGNGRGRARRLFENGHLAEDLPGLKHGDGLLDLLEDLDDLHPPGLDHVEGVPGLVLAEDHVALLESLPEAIERIALGIHASSSPPAPAEPS